MKSLNDTANDSHEANIKILKRIRQNSEIIRTGNKNDQDITTYTLDTQYKYKSTACKSRVIV